MGKRSTCMTGAACAGGEGGGETRGERLQQGIARLQKLKGIAALVLHSWCALGVHFVFLGGCISRPAGTLLSAPGRAIHPPGNCPREGWDRVLCW